MWPYDDETQDPIANLYQQGRIPPLPPQQTASMLSQVGSGITGGLGYVGDLLDKTFGGRGVRGLLGGNPRELLSVLPGSDTLGITDPSQAVSGRHLLNQAGITSEKDPGDEGFDWGDLAGLAAEIGLSPGSLPGKLGTAVPRAVFGGLNKVAKPLGGVAKAVTGIDPYLAGQSVLGEGKRIGKALFNKGTQGTWGKNVQPVAEGTFSPALSAGQDAAEQTHTAFISPLQDIIDKGRETAGRFPDRKAAANAMLTEGYRGIEGDLPTATRNLATAGFNPSEIDTIHGVFGKYVPEQAQAQLKSEQSLGALSKERANLSPAQMAWRDALLQNKVPEDQLPFQLQQKTPYAPATAIDRTRMANDSITGRNPFEIGAEPIYQGLPGGKMNINDLFTGPMAGKERAVSDLNVKNNLSKMIYGHEAGVIPAELAGTEAGKKAWQQATEHIEGLSNRLKNASPAEMKEGVFSNDLPGNILARNYESARVNAGAKAVYKALDKGGGILRKVSDLESEGIPHVKVPEFLNSKMLTHEEGGLPVSQATVADGLDLSYKDAKELRDHLNGYGLPIDVANDINRMGQAWKIPSSLRPVIDAYSGYMQNLKANLTFPFPAFSVRNLVQGYFDRWRGDSLSTAADKSMSAMQRGGSLTEPMARKLYPEVFEKHGANEIPVSFDAHRPMTTNDLHGSSVDPSRNVQIYQTQNGSTGSQSARVTGPISKMKDFFPEGIDIPTGTTISHELPAKSPLPENVATALRDATIQARNDMMSAKLAWSQSNQASEQVGSSMRGSRTIGDLPVVGGEAKPLTEAAGDFLSGYVPSKQSGMDALKAPLDSSTFMPTAQGQKLANSTEDFIRGSHYLSAREKGLDHADAVMEVKKYQRDYSNISQFEQHVMKRLFPFYSFTRANLPPILEDLATKPAKLTGSIRASTDRPDNEFVPEYLGEGTHVNLGKTPEGLTRYLGATGLAYEDEGLKGLGDLLHGDPGKALQGVMGQLTPLAKAPLEQAFGTQLHTGRKLEDVKANIAGKLAAGVPEELGISEPSNAFAQGVSSLVGGTPFSRYATTVGKLADIGKNPVGTLANLLTGQSVQDVDVPLQQQIAVRDRTMKQLAGTPGLQEWNELNIPKDKLAGLNPSQQALYQFYQGLEQKAKQDSKIRKQKKLLASPLEE